MRLHLQCEWVRPFAPCCCPLLFHSTPLHSTPLHSTPCLCWNDAHQFCCFVKFCIILFSIAIISVRDYPSCPNSVIFGRTPLSVPPLPFPPSLRPSLLLTYIPFPSTFFDPFPFALVQKERNSLRASLFLHPLRFLSCFALLCFCVFMCVCV